MSTIPDNPHFPHLRVFEYDGSYKCLDCRKAWGALPGAPKMPGECVKWICPKCLSSQCEWPDTKDCQARQISTLTARVAELVGVLCNNEPYSLRETLKFLREATGHLFLVHSCDAHGHEAWQLAKVQADVIVRKIEAIAPCAAGPALIREAGKLVEQEGRGL